MLPNCTFIQCYNPGSHIIQQGWSETSIFTWLMCGHNLPNKYGNMKILPDVFNKFYWPTRAYLNDLVEGSGIRVEVVISARSSSEVFALVPQYGTRIVDFVLDNQILVVSNKHWPEYVNNQLINLEILKKEVE